MNNPIIPAFIFLAGVLSLANSVNAQITVYAGRDAGYPSGSSVRTQSDTAAAQFDSVIGPHGVITFETTPTGSYTSLSLAPGVTLTGTTQSGGHQAISNAPTGSPSAHYGFNTTLGGSVFASEYTGSLTFTFASPIDTFGAYFSGVEQTTGSLTFNDGSSETIPFATSAAGHGGLEFLGFTDPGAMISSITINAGTDIIGVDDVRYRLAAVPEPRTGLLLGVGLLFLLTFQGRIRREVKAKQIRNSHPGAR
jgi:hypothetical protein